MGERVAPTEWAGKEIHPTFLPLPLPFSCHHRSGKMPQPRLPGIVAFVGSGGPQPRLPLPLALLLLHNL